MEFLKLIAHYLHNNLGFGEKDIHIFSSITKLGQMISPVHHNTTNEWLGRDSTLCLQKSSLLPLMPVLMQVGGRTQSWTCVVSVRRRWQGRFTTRKGKRDQGTCSDLKQGPGLLKVNSQEKKKKKERDTGNHAHKRKTAQESRKRR